MQRIFLEMNKVLINYVILFKYHVEQDFGSPITI